MLIEVRSESEDVGRLLRPPSFSLSSIGVVFIYLGVFVILKILIGITCVFLLIKRFTEKGLWGFRKNYFFPK